MAGTARLTTGRKTDRDGPPLLALVAIAALLGFTMLAVLFGRSAGIGFTVPAPGEAVESLAFRAEDQVDGSIAIRDASDGRLVTMIQPQHDGFIRATLRGLAQHRHHAGLGPEQPFRLTRFEDGRLMVTDPETQREIVLEAFGATNVAAFARLLPGGDHRAP